MTRWSYVLVRVIVLPMPSSMRVFSLEPWNSAGYSRAPAPTMQPWPFIRRGTEWTVPMPPGLVSEIVVPWKSAAVSLLARVREMRSSYEARNSSNVSVSARLMLGTRSARVPSGLGRSIAMPRLMCAGATTEGLPSTSA